MIKVLPTEEMYQDWKAHPVSQAYQEMLKEWRKDLTAQWAAGRFQADGKPLKTAIANAGALSEVTLLTRLIEQDYEQFTQSFDEEEYLRVTPEGKGGTSGAGGDRTG